MTPEIKKLQDKACKVREALRQTISLTQQTCKHEGVVERDYIPPRYEDGYADPPRRVCTNCGLSEVGWGPGYVVLTAPIVGTVGREDFPRLCLGYRVTEEDKGPLLRKEVTIQQLISSS